MNSEEQKQSKQKPSSDETGGDHDQQGPPKENPSKEEGNQQDRKGATGPRTDAGKAQSSKNATKFGEFSKDIFLNEEKDLRQYLRGLKMQIPPRNNLVERELIRLATNRIRRDRLDWHFTSQAELERLKNLKGRAHQEFDRISKLVDQRRMGAFPGSLGSTAHETRASYMRALKEKVESRGPIPAEDLPFIDSVYGPDKTVIANYIILRYQTLKEVGSHREPPAAGVSEFKSEILKLLDLEIELQMVELNDAYALRHIEIVEALYSLPAESSWDRYFKIGSALDREFDQGLQRAKRLNGVDGDPDQLRGQDRQARKPALD
jgi:hypothetical protein